MNRQRQSIDIQKGEHQTKKLEKNLGILEMVFGWNTITINGLYNMINYKGGQGR